MMRFNSAWASIASCPACPMPSFMAKGRVNRFSTLNVAIRKLTMGLPLEQTALLPARARCPLLRCVSCARGSRAMYVREGRAASAMLGTTRSLKQLRRPVDRFPRAVPTGHVPRVEPGLAQRRRCFAADVEAVDAERHDRGFLRQLADPFVHALG